MKAVLILLACATLLSLSLAIGPGSAGQAPIGPRLTPTASRTPQVWLPYIVQPNAPTATYTVTRTPTNTATATATRTATATPTTPVAGPCNCDFNEYNCSDFSTHDEAQACFVHCIVEGQGDIHQLDSDSDGLACEGLP